MKQIFAKTELSMKIFAAATLTLLAFFSFFVLSEIFYNVHDDAITVMYIPILFSLGALLFSWDIFQDKKIISKIISVVCIAFTLFTLWAFWTHIGFLFFS